MNTRTRESMAMPCRVRNSPGAYPVFPQALMNLPSFEYFTTRLLPVTSWPSATKISPLAATATALGEVKYKAVKMAATTTTVEVLHLTFTACLGFGTATATLVSQSLGEKDGDKAARFGWSSVKLGILIFGIIGLFEAGFAPKITAFMSHSDFDVQQAALHPLQMMGIATPLIATAMILTQALFGAGNTKFVMVVELMLHFMCLVPLAWILGVRLDLGIVGLWSAAITYIVLLALIMTLKFKQGSWKSIRI